MHRLLSVCAICVLSAVACENPEGTILEASMTGGSTGGEADSFVEEAAFAGGTHGCMAFLCTPPGGGGGGGYALDGRGGGESTTGGESGTSGEETATDADSTGGTGPVDDTFAEFPVGPSLEFPLGARACDELGVPREPLRCGNEPLCDAVTWQFGGNDPLQISTAPTMEWRIVSAAWCQLNAFAQQKVGRLSVVNCVDCEVGERRTIDIRPGGIAVETVERWNRWGRAKAAQVMQLREPEHYVGCRNSGDPETMLHCIIRWAAPVCVADPNPSMPWNGKECIEG